MLEQASVVGIVSCGLAFVSACVTLVLLCPTPFKCGMRRLRAGVGWTRFWRDFCWTAVACGPLLVGAGAPLWVAPAVVIKVTLACAVLAAVSAAFQSFALWLTREEYERRLGATLKALAEVGDHCRPLPLSIASAVVPSSVAAFFMGSKLPSKRRRSWWGRWWRRAP